MYEDILRNILYAGVWIRYEAAVKEDREKASGSEDPGSSKSSDDPAARDRSEVNSSASDAEREDNNGI